MSDNNISQESQEDLYNGPERREYPRIDTFVVLRALSGTDVSEVTGFTKNISAGGMCLQVNKEIAKDTVISFEINLPGLNSFIPITAKILRSIPVEVGLGPDDLDYELGIKFLEINEKDQEIIAQFVVGQLESQDIEPAASENS